jgi:hypothetical protein
MVEKVQQRMCIDFCLRLGRTGAETYEMLQAAFGESCLSRPKIFEWHSRFKSGRRPGRPSTSHTEETMEHVREIIRADRRLTITEVAEDAEIAFGACQKIRTEDLQMRCVSEIGAPSPD